MLAAALLPTAGDDDFVVALFELEAALVCADEFDFLPGAGVFEVRAPVVARDAAGAAAGVEAGTSAGIGSMVMLADSVRAGDVAETVRTADVGALATGEGAVATYVEGAAAAGLGEAFATAATTGAATAAGGFIGAAAGAGATFAA